MKSFRSILPFLLAAIFAAGASARLGAQDCADHEFEAKKIVFKTDQLRIELSGFFPYQMAAGSGIPKKYASESWQGTGSAGDFSCGCYSSYWDLNWGGGAWTFSTANFTDSSTKSFSYVGTSCGGSNPAPVSLSNLKIGISDDGGLVTTGYNSETATTRRYHQPGPIWQPSSCTPGYMYGETDVTDTLDNEFTLQQAVDRAENNKVVVENSGGLQYWNNFPDNNAVIQMLANHQMSRISPLPAHAERISFQAQFCEPCLGHGKYRITYYYKVWAIGSPEPSECETKTEDVEFKDAPYVVPASGFKPYHIELKQGEQARLVKVTARSAEDCAKREPGSMSAQNKSVDVFFFLGKRNDGAGAGALAISATSVASALYSPAALQWLAGDHSEVTVIKQADVLRQVKAPQTLADVVVINANEYEIRFYLPSQVGALTSGVHAVSGAPYVTYRVENPDGGSSSTRLLITEVRGGNEEETLYAYNSGTGALALTTGNGLRTEELLKTVTGPTTTEIRTIKNAADAVVSVVRETKYNFAFGNNVTSREVDPFGADLTTTYTYYDNPATDGGAYGQVKLMFEPSGRWTRYSYDASGRPSMTVTQFLNTASGSADNLNQVTTITYETISDQDGDSIPEEIIITVQSLVGQEIGRSYEVKFTQLGTAFGASIETVWDIQGTVAGAAWNASTNLVTKRRVIDSGRWLGRTVSELRPDGTLTTYAYAADSNYVTITTHAGEANSGGTAVVAGVKTISVDTLLGQPVSREVYDYSTSAETLLTGESVTQTDSFGRATRIDYFDGTFELRSYACCGLDAVTDRQGVTTHYTYDELGRLIETAQLGITTKNTLDAEGRIVAVTRIGTDDSEIVTSSQSYDVAGRLAWSKDALNRQTTFGETINGSGHTVRTTTTPEAGTVIRTYAKDGSLLSVTGTAAPQRLAYEYGVEADGVFTKEIRVGGSGETTEWTKSYTDVAGRAYKRVHADAAAEQSYFNSVGQVVRQVDADGVTLLYAYNAKGEQEVAAVDLNADQIIDYAGTDRVTRTLNTVASRDSYLVQRSTTQIWEIDGANTPVTASVAETTFDGLRAWQTVRGLTTTVVTTIIGPGDRTVTTTVPDGTVTTQTFTDEQLVSVVVTRASLGTLSSTSYTYDPHGRLATTSQLSPTNTSLVTTYAYFADDRIESVTTPDPDGSGSTHTAQVTSYTYDSAGRVYQVSQPDSTVVHTTYWPTGQAKRTWGSRTYPVEYTYDPQGRMKSLTTWKDFGGSTGTAVTTWNYSATRGLLANKRYADNTGPNYMYKPSGRLVTREWARGITTTYAYNAAGDVSGIDYSDSTTDATIAYDRAGRPKTRTDAAGVATLSYHTSGQLENESYASGLLSGLTVNRSYDGQARLNSVEAQGPAISALTSYAYDAASRLETVTSGLHTATYGYLPNTPLVQSVTFAKNGTTRLTTTRAYDDLYRLTSIDSTPSAGTAVNCAYTYNAANQRTRLTRQDGARWDYGYDALGQVESAVKKTNAGTTLPGYDFGFAYDDIGNRGNTTTNGGTPATYTSNNLNQYTQRAVPGVIQTVGTATSDSVVTVDGLATTREGVDWHYSLGVSNAIKGVWKELAVTGVRPNAGPGGDDAVALDIRTTWIPKNPETFTYDADGNLLTDGRWSYTWDGENRLAAMETNPVILPPGGNFPLSERRKLEFTYDLQGRRAAKHVSHWTLTGWQVADTTLFLYDGWNLIAEIEETVTPTLARTHAWGLDLSGSFQGAGGVGGLLFTTLATPFSTHAPAYDGNGNVIAYVDLATGATSANFEYGAFGDTLVTDGAWREALPFRFSTKFTDGESGLVYYGLRYYSPGSDRWLNRDPIEENGGLNLYAMVGNNSINLVDPLGLNAACIALAAEITVQAGKLAAEFLKFDPVADARGGHIRGGTRQVGGRSYPNRTKPGGHYREMMDLKRGLWNRLDEFKKNCWDDDDCDDPPKIPVWVWEVAKRPIPAPITPLNPFQQWAVSVAEESIPSPGEAFLYGAGGAAVGIGAAVGAPLVVAGGGLFGLAPAYQ